MATPSACRMQRGPPSHPSPFPPYQSEAQVIGANGIGLDLMVDFLAGGFRYRGTMTHLMTDFPFGQRGTVTGIMNDEGGAGTATVSISFKDGRIMTLAACRAVTI